MKIAKYRLSIVVATHKRQAVFKRLLQSLSHQITKQVELIIIHNSYGLSKARNKGWQKAKGQYIAYIDDDAVASKDWVKAILGFTRTHRDVAAFGGPYESINRRDLPTWIPTALTRHNLGNRIRRLSIGREWLTGTNMIFSKQVLKKAGGFNESLGLVGKKRSYGEETDLQLRLHNAGHAIWYDPKIKVEHEYAAWKQNLSYLLHNHYVLGRESVTLFRNVRVKSSVIKNGRENKQKLSQQIVYGFLIISYAIGKVVGIVQRFYGKK